LFYIGDSLRVHGEESDRLKVSGWADHQHWYRTPASSIRVCEVTTTSTKKPDMNNKFKTTAFLLCYFLGILGVHRFYLYKTRSWILMFLISMLYTAPVHRFHHGRFLKQTGAA